MRSFLDKNEAVEVLRSVVPDVVAAISNIRDPGAPAIGYWTAGDVAAHLVDLTEDNLRVARGEGTPYASPAEVAVTNQTRLDARPERNPRRLASLYEEAASRYLEYLTSVQEDRIIRWGGFNIPLSTLVAADVGECLVHGWDINRAENRVWKIDPYHASLVAQGLSPLTIHYVDPEAAKGFNGTFDLRLRRHWALHFVFVQGTLSIKEPSDRPVDAHISADPVAFLLVGYGRLSQWVPTVRGQLLAWGRKPWLALKFASLLRNP